LSIAFGLLLAIECCHLTRNLLDRISEDKIQRSKPRPQGLGETSEIRQGSSDVSGARLTLSLYTHRPIQWRQLEPRDAAGQRVYRATHPDRCNAILETQRFLALALFLLLARSLSSLSLSLTRSLALSLSIYLPTYLSLSFSLALSLFLSLSLYTYIHTDIYIYIYIYKHLYIFHYIT
jgi:hypothetical protein